MQGSEIHEANPQTSGSGQDPYREFQHSDKLRAKLEKLAPWRLDPSLIEFPGDAPEFRGGFATVSQAHLASTLNRQTSKLVAVKKLKVENDADVERVLGLALRESEFVARLSHPNVVKFEGFVEDTSKHMIWLVFPWQENGNLRDFLASGEWEIPERISLIDDVAQGVEYLHSRAPPVYHGDLQSLNIVVNPEFRAVITNFGSARRLETEDFDKDAKKRELQPRPEQATGEENITLQAVYSASTYTITLTGDKYTRRWVAPELLREELPSLACDIWALGWIAYEAMTNAIPFRDVKRDVAVVNRVIQGDLPSITNHPRMSLIQALCSLVAQCWSMNPEKRPTAEFCVKLISWMALEIYATTENTRGKADALRDLAEVHRLLAKYSMAAAFYSEALRLYTDLDNDRCRAYALWGLGEVHRQLGEYAAASTSYSEALQISTDIGDHYGIGNALSGLADIHRLRGEYDEAITLYTESLQIREETGFSLGRAEILWNLGEVHRSRGEYSEAIKFHSESLQIYTEMGNRSGQAQALSGLASVHLSRGEYDDAASFYSESLQISTDIGEQHRRAGVLLGLARTHNAQGHRSEAISRYTDASDAYREVGDSWSAAGALKKAADLRTEEAA